jgi:deoxyhypusine synthase
MLQADVFGIRETPKFILFLSQLEKSMRSRDQKKMKSMNPAASGRKPVSPLDLTQCNTIGTLVEAMGKTSFGGRQVGRAAEILEKMSRDDCWRVLTLSGAMTVAKMGLVICDMIRYGMVDAIVSTGALMCHGMVEGIGRDHYQATPGESDAKLYEEGYDRVYDTLEPESNLDEVEEMVAEVLAGMPKNETVGSFEFMEAVGDHLLEKYPDSRSVLGTARQYGVPVYIPAFTDSEVGLDWAIFQDAHQEKNIQFDPFIDLRDFASMGLQHEKWGIFTIGGGVPRNWAQQVAPYVDILVARGQLDKEQGQIGDQARVFSYGVRICPEPVHWGGLSGCTYSEGVSWGKFLPVEEGGQYAEVHCDATIAWPLIVKAAIEKRAKFDIPVYNKEVINDQEMIDLRRNLGVRVHDMYLSAESELGYNIMELTACLHHGHPWPGKLRQDLARWFKQRARKD